MRSFGVPVEAAARPQPVDRSRSRRRTSAAIKRVLARILVRRHSQPAAIHATAVLRDGTAVQLRAIRPDDKERLRIAFERLSRRSVYRRFFHPVKALTPNVLRQLTELDFRDHVGLVLSVEDETGERLIAVGRFVRVAPRSEHAEFAITVADDYQNRGAGTLLLQRLVDIARAGGVREFVAYVLEENRQMLKVIRGTELPCRRTSEDGVRLVVMSLIDD
jgi:RimJ/RimL family protein N-acetyltransferase